MPIPSFDLHLLDWVTIPAGSVTLQKGWNGEIYSEEKAGTYQVEPFRIAKYPVTNAQFKVFVEDNGYGDDRWWQALPVRIAKPKRGKWRGANHPRESITWYEALAFCRWLSDKLECTITLPTEMQWQRAAQGDDRRKYPWGKDFDHSRCNSYENGLKRTTPVDHYLNGTSPYGVMDMSGNVWEWCLNEYKTPENSDLSGEAYRAIRGGSWFNEHYNAQTVFRSGFRPMNYNDNIGFRVIQGVD